MRPVRRGFTLIEVVLIVGAVAVVLGLCAGMLRGLLRLDRSARSHLVETATLGRLARQFRLDVHAAESVQQGEGRKLELRLAEGRTIVYEARGDALARTQDKRGEVERRETYTLPFHRDLRFEVQWTGGKAWARLRLAGSRRELQIDALAGRDLRFATRGENTP